MTTEARDHWLERLVGDWTFEADTTVTPEGPTGKYRGTETVRSLDGVWVVCEAHGVMPGAGTQTTLTTLGYDAERERYVGTVVGSMMSHIWLYEGELDAAGTRLRLETEGPSYEEEGKISKYVDVIEIVGEDERLLRSTYLGADGAWHEFMVTRYRREG